MLPLVLRLTALLLVLGAAYVGLAWVMRRQVARELERNHANGVSPSLTREDYVAKGLADYERSWARKSLIGIVLVPFLVAIGLILLANYG